MDMYLYYNIFSAEPDRFFFGCVKLQAPGKQPPADRAIEYAKKFIADECKLQAVMSSPIMYSMYPIERGR